MTIPFTGVRGAVARAMTSAWEAPRVAIGIDVDMTRCLERQRALREEVSSGVRVTVTHFALRAVALALREHPRLNAHVSAGGVTLVEHVHVGLAVDVGEGVVVPVIRDVDTKSIETIAVEAAELADRARGNRLATSAMLGGTFTVSTLGATGIDWFTPIINRPQVGIVGVGATTKRAFAVGDDVAVVPVMTVTLVFDHRAVDGYPAGQFLHGVAALLQEPAEL